MDYQREYDVLEEAAIYLQEAKELLDEIYGETDFDEIHWHTDRAYVRARSRLNQLKHAMEEDER